MSTPTRPLRVLVAPDSFKGTMSAATVADAIAAGVRDVGATPDLCPLADGGEGTVDALQASIPGTAATHTVTAPDGQPTQASYLRADDHAIALIETAAGSGLHLIDPASVDAYVATSAGTGQLLAAAAATGVREIVLGVGGSGFSDGGLGALTAIESHGGLGDAKLTVLCDVTTTYQDAARIYGPQKGADPRTIERLTRRLDNAAASFPRDPRGVPHTGAAGGLAGALWACHDAKLVSGIDEILHRVDFTRRLAAAALVITGEGRLDRQTTQGKVIDGVTRWARTASTPVYAVVGQNCAHPQVLDSLAIAGVAEAGTPDQLRRAAQRITNDFQASGPSLQQQEEMSS